MTIDRMIELLEIERECVLRNACGDCNRYCAECDLLQDDTELHEMYTSVIDLVKEEKPRVISVNEIKAMSFVWLEDIDKKKVIPALFCWRGRSVVMYAIEKHFIRVWIDEYGIRWRAWTRWPSDKLRGETPWVE